MPTTRQHLFREPRWWSWLAVSLLGAIVCVLLGQWQWARWEMRHALATAVQQNYDAPAKPVLDVLDPLSDRAWRSPDPIVLATEQSWTVISARGQFLDDTTRILRNRPLDQVPGYEILTAFRLDSGELLWVNRGWLDNRELTDSPHVPPAPPETQTIKARTVGYEQYRDPARQIPGHVTSTHPLALDPEATLGPPLNAVAELIDESANPVLLPLGKPDLAKGGLNLAYAFQWWFFALAGLVMFTRFTLLELGHQWASESRRKTRIKDEDIEDAILDQLESSDGNSRS